MIAASQTKPPIQRSIRLQLLRVALLAFVCIATQIFAVSASAQLPTPTLVPYTFAPYAANPGYVRAGVPILFTGRMLPADATGTLTFMVDGVPEQTSTLATQSFSDYVALGDSITAADYIGNPAQRYQAIVAANLNLIPSWYASPGMTSCDNLTDFVIPNGLGLQTTSTPLYSVLLGNNDRLYFGVGAGEQFFEACHQAMLSWIGTPAASKVIPGSSGVAVQSGTWITAPPFGQCCFNVNVLTNSTGSGTVRFTLATTGNAAYLWYQTQIASPGSFTVSVDGGPPGAPISTSFPANSSAFAIPGSYALLRLPVAAGTHTFDITAQGGAQGGTVGLLGMGSMPATGQRTTVLVGDVPNELAQANAAGIAEYTADIKADIALLAADGLDLRFVPTQQYMLGTPAELVDGAHPNQLGLSELAQAFTAAVTPSTPVADTITLAAASFQTSSIPIGSHGIAILYSGDSHNAPTSVGEFSMVIADGTSSVSLASDASIYTTQSPITLTATVPTVDAIGQVTFFDISGATPVQLGNTWIQVGNTVSLVVPSLSAGQHTLMAQYAGDIHFNGSSSPPIVVNISGAYTTTSLSAPATRYPAGSPVALTAAVSPTSATGTVSFFDGTTALAQLPLAAGFATLTTSALAAGMHSLTASYSGNGSQDSSQSAALAIEIDPGPTSLAIAAVPLAPTFGNSVTLTATISPVTADGLVTFYDGTQSIGQTSLVHGVATLSISTLTSGWHTISASYNGDGSGYLASTSAGVGVLVLGLTPTLTPFSYAYLGAEPAFVRYGVPILFSARILPADATGTVTFSVDAGPGQTVQLAPQSNGDYFSLGDSITAADQLGTPILRYTDILAQQNNLYLTRVAAPGYEACQVMPFEILDFNVGNTPAMTPLYTLMIGTNDADFQGTGVHEADFNLCHQATLSWLGTTRQNKILAGDSGVATTSGTWTTQPASDRCCFNTLSTTSSGSLRFTLSTSRGAAYLWYGMQAAAGGTFTISVDGGPPSTAVPTQYTSTEAIDSSYGLLRVPVASGSHTFDIVAQGAVNILGMGMAAAAGSIPTVLVSDVPNQQSSNGHNAAIAEYTSDVQANAALLQADGLDLRFVQTQKYFFGTLAETSGDGIHPNALGQAEIAQAFEAAIATAPISDSNVAPTASLTLNNIPIGSHNIFMFYSGDSKYAGVESLAGMTIYDGTSTTLLSSDASVYQAQQAIQLTAATIPDDVSGEVEFVDVTPSGNVPLGIAWEYPATLSVSGLSPGQHSLVAQYLGNFGLNPSSSTPLAITVSPATSTSLTAPNTRYSSGSPVVLTATVSPATATGTITFSDGATVLAQVPLTSGSATFSTSSLAPGIHSLTAAYSGTSQWNSSVSPPLAIEIDLSPSTVSASSLPTMLPYGAALALSASVSPTSASGSVTFSDSFIPAGHTTAQTQTLGQPVITAALADMTAFSLGAGTHSITPIYSGDANVLPSVGATNTVQIPSAQPSIYMFPSASTVALGASQTFTANVIATGKPPIPVVLQNLAEAINQTTVFAGDSLTAYWPLPINNVGHIGETAAEILSTFPADVLGHGYERIILLAGTNDILHTGNDPATTIVSIQAMANIATSGGIPIFLCTIPDITQPGIDNNRVLQLNAAITAFAAQNGYPLIDYHAALTGHPEYSYDGVHLYPIGQSVQETVVAQTVLIPTGSITFSGSNATIGLSTTGVVSNTISFPTAGVQTITANFSGDANFLPATGSVTVTVTQDTSSITLAPPAATIYLGNPVSLSASVTPASATGTVTFRDATLGTLGQSTVAHGAATLTLPSPAAGTYSITAYYSGDTNDTAATSNTVATQIVLNATSLALTSSANPASAATPVTLLATLSPATATGTITFFDGSSSIGTAMLIGGKASFTTSTLAPGSHTLHATYSGDALDAASSSATLAETVNANASTTSLSLAQSSVVIGATITFNVRVTDAYASPTGTVSVVSGATTLASAPLANASAGTGYATLSINSSTLGIGSFPVVAVYSGDNNDQPSSSSATSVSVTAMPTTATLTLSSAQIPVQSGITIIASVASAGAIPTGSISFLSNGAPLATEQLNSAGTASYYLDESAMGTYAITAVYTPSGLFAAASIAPATLLVTAPLSATINPSTISANPGATVSANLTITPLSGFTGAIQTACQTTVAFVTCSLNAPANVTGPTTIPIQISIAQSNAALALPAHRGALAITFALMLPLLTLRRSRRMFSLIFVALLSLYLSGCANGGDFNSIPAGAQTVAVTITAAGVAYTTDITVNVAQ